MYMYIFKLPLWTVVSFNTETTNYEENPPL